MKTLTVTQYVKELVYDIRNKAYLTGQAREAEGETNYEAASDMQATDEDGNLYQIRRTLANTFSCLKDLLGEYLDAETTTSDNRITEEIDNDGVLTLAFILPGNYNNVSAESLGNGIHAYLVDMTLAEWFAITSKEDSQIYIRHSTTSLEIVRRALYRRSRPKRPTYV